MGFVTLNFELFIAEFISFSWKSQPILISRESAVVYCMYLLHNTYIHTYIPPLGGVCMYVCMYIVKNNILYNYCNCMYIVKISQFELDFEFSELLMMQFELEICSV